MATPPPNPNSSSPLQVIALLLIVAALYFTRDICIPIILAILLSFVLSPVVGWMQSRHLPRVPAVTLVVGLLLATLAFSGWLVGGEVVSLAEQLPQYQANVHEKLKSFQTAPGGLVDRLTRTLDTYTKEFESIGAKPAPAPSASPASQPDSTTPAPVPVAIVTTQTSKLAAIERMSLGLLGPVTTFGVVMLLTLFMLIRQEDVRDRTIRLLGGGKLHLATQALDDAGNRVSRYLLIQFIVNAAFGLCICLGLFLLGIPYSLLWGLLAACLRFVPYFGAPLSAIPPLLMAFAATPGWSPVILTLILFATLELSTANLIEPWLYGSSARISPLAIVGSAIFWSWLWGPIGLLLSTPLTVCLVVMGRHVPQLWFLTVILGDEPVLAPEARFYQRLLADDQAEAWEIAERKLHDSSHLALYDAMIVPALILAEEDRHSDALDNVHEKVVFQGIRDLLEDLAQRPATIADPAIPPPPSFPPTERAVIGPERDDSAPTIPAAPPPARKPLNILCIPANDQADELAALMLAHLLRQRGMTVEVLSFTSLAGERLDAVTQHLADVVCVSAMPPQALQHARFMCKRLRSRHASLKIIAGIWHTPDDPQKQRLLALLPPTLADDLVTTLAAAVARIDSLASLESFRTDAPEKTTLPPAPRPSKVPATA